MLVTGQVKLMVGELTESYCVVVVKLPIIGGAKMMMLEWWQATLASE